MLIYTEYVRLSPSFSLQKEYTVLLLKLFQELLTIGKNQGPKGKHHSWLLS